MAVKYSECAKADKSDDANYSPRSSPSYDVMNDVINPSTDQEDSSHEDGPNSFCWDLKKDPAAPDGHLQRSVRSSAAEQSPARPSSQASRFFQVRNVDQTPDTDDRGAAEFRGRAELSVVAGHR